MKKTSTEKKTNQKQKKKSVFKRVYYAPPHPAVNAGARRLKRVASKREQAALAQWFESRLYIAQTFATKISETISERSNG